MSKKTTSLRAYDRQTTAERYHRGKGFASWRKEKLDEVALDFLVALTPPQAVLLELGAGTGHFTKRVIASGRFGRIHVTDGAPAMLDVAQQTLPKEDGLLQFSILDFANEWAGQFGEQAFDAVTSTMALHHAADKQRLFEQIFKVLKPGGIFVFGDHMAANSALGQYLIDRERALIKLGRDKQDDEARIRDQIKIDEWRQKAEGDQCESVSQYLTYLSAVGFVEADCLWQDFWLAVFVGRRAE